MLRVTIELVPWGDEDRARVLACAVISKGGSGDRDVGNYEVLLYPEEATHDTRLRRHRRAEGAVRLVAKALSPALGVAPVAAASLKGQWLRPGVRQPYSKRETHG